MTQLIPALRLALADTWSFYFKAHSFHWNITGSNFPQFHELFGKLYEDLHGAVDDLAEKLRIMDAMAPASLDEIRKGSKITFGPVPDCMGMLKQLHDANSATIASLEDANEAAVEDGEDGIANFLQGRLDAHGKWGWQLRASMKERKA